jgi:hypothetical protein
MQQIAIMEREGAPLRFQLEGDYNASDIGAAVDALITLLDKRFAPYDPDEPIFSRAISDGKAGDPDDAEPEADLEAGAYVEWHTKPRVLRTLQEFNVGHEDDEDADPAEEDDPSGQCDEDGINTNLTAQWAAEPGCAVSDPGEDGDSDRCEAGDDHIIAGAVALNDFWIHRRGLHIGAECDREPNGDEGDYSEGLPHR